MKEEHFDIWLAIGLNILYYRKEQGLTQMQLAENAISAEHICKKSKPQIVPAH